MNTTDDVLLDDATHPIPEVGACDIKGVRKDGGGDLVVVIAAPLEDDERSRRRFVQKIRNYLGYIISVSRRAELTREQALGIDPPRVKERACFWWRGGSVVTLLC